MCFTKLGQGSRPWELGLAARRPRLAGRELKIQNYKKTKNQIVEEWYLFYQIIESLYLFYQIGPVSHGSRPWEPGLAARRGRLAGDVRILYHMSESGQFMCKLGTIYPDVSFCSSFSFSFLPLPLSLPLSLSFLCLSFSSILILSSSNPPHFSFSVFLRSLFLTLSLYHVAFLCFSLRLLIRSNILCYLLSRAVFSYVVLFVVSFARALLCFMLCSCIVLSLPFWDIVLYVIPWYYILLHRNDCTITYYTIMYYSAGCSS